NRLVRLTLTDHFAHEEASSRLPSRHGIHFPRIDVMRNPLLPAIVASIPARRIAHHPQGPDTSSFVGEGAAPYGAGPAHEHLNRELHFPVRTGHRGRVLWSLQDRRVCGEPSSSPGKSAAAYLDRPLLAQILADKILNHAERIFGARRSLVTLRTFLFG